MTNPFDDDEKPPAKPALVRLTVDAKPEDVALLDAVAAFRNEMYVQKHNKRRQRLVKRKHEAQRMFGAAVDHLREQLREMTEACGPIPDAKDKAAMKRYVQRVSAWNQRTFGAK